MASDASIAPLSPNEIQPLLRTRVLGRILHSYGAVESTNRVALTLAAQQAPSGTVVVAEMQSNGRGRLGRAWHSPPHVNLYCSILLRPSSAATDLTSWLCWLPLVTGLGILCSVQRITGLMPKLKWPNDVIMGSGKVAGILCESHVTRQPWQCVIVGIGINVNASKEDFPPDIAPHATSLACELGHHCSRAGLLAALLNEVEGRYEAIALSVPSEIVQEYRARCSTLGREVQVTLASGEVVHGIAQLLTDQGALEVTNLDTLRTDVIYAGDVVHVR